MAEVEIIQSQPQLCSFEKGAMVEAAYFWEGGRILKQGRAEGSSGVYGLVLSLGFYVGASAAECSRAQEDLGACLRVESMGLSIPSNSKTKPRARLRV